MDAPEPQQLLILKRLDAEAQTIDTGLAEMFQLRAIDGLGIGLDGDLGTGIEIERLADRADDAADLGRLEQRWRAAAEKNGVGLQPGWRRPDLALQRRDLS